MDLSSIHACNCSDKILRAEEFHLVINNTSYICILRLMLFFSASPLRRLLHCRHTCNDLLTWVMDIVIRHPSHRCIRSTAWMWLKSHLSNAEVRQRTQSQTSVDRTRLVLSGLITHTRRLSFPLCTVSQARLWLEDEWRWSVHDMPMGPGDHNPWTVAIGSS